MGNRLPLHNLPDGIEQVVAVSANAPVKQGSPFLCRERLFTLRPGLADIRAPKDLLSRLEQAEVARVGRMMAAERGLSFSQAKPGEYVSGRLAGAAKLASGRFAMIDDGVGFQLVPWQPALDKRIGQHIGGLVRETGGIEWSFGRNGGSGCEERQAYFGLTDCRERAMGGHGNMSLDDRSGPFADRRLLCSYLS
ncbi:DUF3363 domain-containing protein [Mesorhizobium sp. B283B1A]|uniref:DUF3363 domain-containing protein n=1 Tax=Mesorhizobium opportunistum TaxID=593909 RepID=UPI001CD0BEE4|nr:DUF3363 domain-containing protein [Mesorhizobium opportunistum]MCA0050645.1 DUF3363 domain-containing protein [Mesorhizobium sp. B283B1A]UQS66923.1 DUF3363 domain-containing protein [Mesorhizobium opportunistum]